MIRLNSHKCYFLRDISLSYKKLMLYLDHDRHFSLSYHSHVGMDNFFTLQSFFPTSHTDSSFVGASDIGQESALFSTPMY